MIRTIGCISDKFKFIVILIPKNASSTIRWEFRKSIFECAEIPDDNWTKNQIEHYAKFTFLRNPVDRFFSGYYEVYKRYLREDGLLTLNKPKADRNANFLNKRDHIDTIYEFVGHIKQRGYFDNHIRKQVSILKQYKIDNYFSVQAINPGIREITTRFEIPYITSDLPHYKQRSRTKKSIDFNYHKEDMPADLIAAIRNLYLEDMALFENIPNYISNKGT